MVIRSSLKANMTKNFWMCILTTALPMRVAPKKVQKGTRKWPHVMPARSNRGLGIWRRTLMMQRKLYRVTENECDFLKLFFWLLVLFSAFC